MSFDPAVSWQAAADVFTVTRPSGPPQAYSAGEREVARAGRIMRQIIKEKSLAAQEADRQVADSKKRAWATFAELVAALYAAEDTITDPRVRALMETVTKDLLDRQYRHMGGFLEVVAEQFAHQINRDITPAPPGQLTFLQAVVGVLGG